MRLGVVVTPISLLPGGAGRAAGGGGGGVDRQSGWRLSPLLPASLSFSHGDGAAIVVIQVAEVGNGTVVPVIGAVP